MSNREKLERIFSGEVTEIQRVESRSGDVFKVIKNRGDFDDEVLIIRYLSDEPDYEALRDEDNEYLKQLFYDNATPNQWNLQLFWVYSDKNAPSRSWQRLFEKNTKFAMRRCIPEESSSEILSPLQASHQQIVDLESASIRSELIEQLFENGLGALFDDSKTLEEKKDHLLEEEQTNINNKINSIKEWEASREFIDHVSLGNQYRKNDKNQISKREFDAASFTLLEGRNGTGKTTFLDGITMGMVGQTRNDENRVDDYQGLEITLKGENKPLSTDTDVLSSRIAGWYGYRPRTKQPRHMEFYRVNYHPAGQTTRLLHSEEDIELQTTISRLLYGDELSMARKESDNISDDFNLKIKRIRANIEETVVEREELKDKRERLNSVLSDVAVVARDLSPAGRQLIEQGVGNETKSIAEPTPDQVEQWTTWKSRLERVTEAVEVAPNVSMDSINTSRDLGKKLKNEKRYIASNHDALDNAEELLSKRSHIQSLKNHFGEQQIHLPPSMAFMSLVFQEAGFEISNITALTEAWMSLSEPPEPRNSVSINRWREEFEGAVRSTLEKRTSYREELEEIDDLQQELRQKQERIRTLTEEYVQTKDSEYCPACYKKQSTEEILTREKPADFHGNTSTEIPEQLREDIETLEGALTLLQGDEWNLLEELISSKYNDICDIDQLHTLWVEYLTAEESNDALLRVSHREVSVLAWVLRSDKLSASVGSDIMNLLSEAETKLYEEAQAELSKGDFDMQRFSRDHIQAEQTELENDKNILQDGIEVLETHWPESATDLHLSLNADLRITNRVVDLLREDIPTARTTDELTADIEVADKEIEQLNSELHKYHDTLGRIRSAFEDGFSDDQLEEYIEQHTQVVATLFKAFQRPFEFDQVRMSNDHLEVHREGHEDWEGIGKMSSGQRAALGLAIFVANNLAHNAAPKVMMLDEPFAHLDDINSLSFFNLLIELATPLESQVERQVIFATASDDISQLLKRKIGETSQFRHIELKHT
ncbi:hypothetical protein JCM17823_16320 [Halorubrum gandharaense]